MMSLCFIISCDECDTVGGPTTYLHLNVGSMITPQSEEKIYIYIWIAKNN